LKKKWIIINNKRVLVKGGSGYFEQEPYNEAIASIILEKLDFKHVSYSLEFIDDKPYSVCDNFIDESTELVTAWRVRNHFKKQPHISEYEHLLSCCAKIGLGDVRRKFEEMIVFDYLIGNSDRHFNNFGFIRNADTLEWLGFAPLYDNGTSLWHDKHKTDKVVECKSFSKNLSEQLKLVKDFCWFEPLEDTDISKIVMDILDKHPFMETSRKTMIADAVIRNNEYLRTLKISNTTRLK
jgi:hypothetical protein